MFNVKLEPARKFRKSELKTLKNGEEIRVGKYHFRILPKTKPLLQSVWKKE